MHAIRVFNNANFVPEPQSVWPAKPSHIRIRCTTFAKIIRSRLESEHAAAREPLAFVTVDPDVAP